jgi:hypothetical protein
VRDVRTGVQQERFTSDDPVTSFIALSGTVIAGVMAQQMTLDANSPVHHLSRFIGGSLEDLPQRISKTALMSLGISPEQADAISSSVEDQL